MARRKLSTQGRVAAAGVSVAVAGVLAGFMAAGDHAANATQPSSPSSSSSSNDTGAFDTPSGSTATPYPGTDDFGNRAGDDQYRGGTNYQPEPQTHSGGS
jgi:hypothetical protein